MSKQCPILITGAGGDVGSISKTMINMLIEKKHPVRAFVRKDDERAQALRKLGAEIFVGDLLNVADVAAALKGCRRVYFSMSLNPYYTDATILMAAAARAQGDLEVFLNISEFEQSYMDFTRMTAPFEARREWLGGLVTDWSPQQRAHWASEQALNWCGLPVVNIRATMFVENPILAWFPLKQLLSAGELHLPFGKHKISPIAAYDVAGVPEAVVHGKTGLLSAPGDVDGLSASNSPAVASPSLVMKTRNAKNAAVSSAVAAAATTQSGRRADGCAMVAARPCQRGEMSSPARALK